MNDTATRSEPSRANAMAMPAIESEPMASGAVAGSTPQPKSPVCKSLPNIGGPSLPICAVITFRTASASCAHGEPSADVADHRRDHVALPRPIVATMGPDRA